MRVMATVTAMAALLTGCAGGIRGGPIGTCGMDHWEAVGRKVGSVMYRFEDGSVEQDQQIARLREWAVTLKDPCDKANYLRWLDFYDKSGARLRRLREKMLLIPDPPTPASSGGER